MFIVFIILLVVFVGGMLFRNNRTLAYRQRLIDQVSAACMDDLKRDPLSTDWWWRWDVYNSVSYDEMAIKFWRRFDSFYPDKRFTQPGAPHKKVSNN